MGKRNEGTGMIDHGLKERFLGFIDLVKKDLIESERYPTEQGCGFCSWQSGDHDPECLWGQAENMKRWMECVPSMSIRIVQSSAPERELSTIPLDGNPRVLTCVAASDSRLPVIDLSTKAPITVEVTAEGMKFLKEAAGRGSGSELAALEELLRIGLAAVVEVHR